jgi:sulfur relay (sulfurtransferase) DsrC/TusE family protein
VTNAISYGVPFGGGVHEKEGERKKLKSAENETRAPRPSARQIGCAGQFAIPEVTEDAWEVLYFARNYFGSMTPSPLI